MKPDSAERSASAKDFRYGRTASPGDLPLQPAHVCAGRGRPHRRHACRHLHPGSLQGGEKVSCNKAGAEAVGKETRLAKEKSIEKVVFDRNGYLTTARSRPWPMAPAKAASSSNPERIALSWNRMNWVSSRRSSPEPGCQSRERRSSLQLQRPDGRWRW